MDGALVDEFWLSPARQDWEVEVAELGRYRQGIGLVVQVLRREPDLDVREHAWGDHGGRGNSAGLVVGVIQQGPDGEGLALAREDAKAAPYLCDVPELDVDLVDASDLIVPEGDDVRREPERASLAILASTVDRVTWVLQEVDLRLHLLDDFIVVQGLLGVQGRRHRRS